INLQSKFLQAKDLGYNDENLLKISLPFNKDGTSVALKNELRQHVQFGTATLGNLTTNSGWEVKEGNVQALSYFMPVDEAFLETTQLKLKAGRNFDSQDHHSIVLVNETCVDKFDIEHPVGRTMTTTQGSAVTIIGVVRDFQPDALNPMSPLILLNTHTGRGDSYDLFLRLRSTDISKDLSEIAGIFRKHFPYYPFDAQFQDDINERRYRAALRWQQIVNYASGMAIFIACCGLLGLSLLSAQSR